MHLNSLCLSTLLAVLIAAPAAAQVDITFDDIPTGTDLHGMTVQGVTFDYASTSGNHFDSSGGPGCLTFVCDPSAEGGTAGGTLSMWFTDALNVFSFGFATSSFVATSVLVTPYSVFGAALGSTVLGLSPISSFAEGMYTYTGSDALSGVAIDLDYDAAIGPQFVIDNISGELAGVAVPEPATLLLLASGLACVGLVSRRRRWSGKLAA